MKRQTLSRLVGFFFIVMAVAAAKGNPVHAVGPNCTLIVCPAGSFCCQLDSRRFTCLPLGAPCPP